MEDLYSILCIDDEKNILLSLNRILRKKNFKVFLAESGQEGLDILKREEISLILCDQRMPHMNGCEVLREAKKLKPDVVRIMLSGYSDFDSLVQTINEGEVYRYLLKPWNSDQLIESIHSALEQRKKMININTLLKSFRLLTDMIKNTNIKQDYEQMATVVNVELYEKNYDSSVINAVVNHLFEVLEFDNKDIQGINWILKNETSLKLECSLEKGIKIIINIKTASE